MGMICGVASKFYLDEHDFIARLQSLAQKYSSALNRSGDSAFGCVSSGLPFFDGDGILAAVDGFFSNQPELAASIGMRSTEFACPAQLLAALYRHDPEKFLDLTDGSFSFLLFDETRKKLLFGADRFGSRKMFYFPAEKNTIVANNLDLLKNYPGLNLEVDMASVGDFLSLQYIPAPQTLYKKVKKLPPASVAVVDLDSGDCQIKRYWDRRNVGKKENISFADAAQELRKLFLDSVSAYGRFSDKSGAFLSGGIDSAVTVGCLGAIFPDRKWNLYSLGFAPNEYDESCQIELNYRKLKSHDIDFNRHFFRADEEELFSNLEECVGNMDEPLGDASLLATGFLSRKASCDGIEYIFSGDGADELFGGYDRYRAIGMSKFFLAVPRWLLRGSANILSFAGKAAGERSSIARARRFLAGIADGENVGQIYFNWLDRAPVAIKEKLLFGADLPGSDRHFVEYSMANPVNLPSQIIAENLDLEFYLPFDGAAKLNYASKLSGVKFLTPFLDRKLAEFAAALPWRFKQDLFRRKKVLCAAFADCLPSKTISSAKRGFGVPVAAWLRQDAGYDICREKLTASGGKLFDMELALDLLEAHHKGEADHSYLLWNLLVLSMFLQLKTV